MHLFVDDAVIHRHSFEMHHQFLRRVFDIIKNAKLRINPKQSTFASNSVKYLGFCFSEKGVCVDEKRLDRIRNLQPAKNVREVKQILGLLSFYRSHIKSFAVIATPMRRLLQKTEEPFKWTPECTDALEKLKNALVTNVVLIYPEMNKPFSIITDASSFRRWGCVTTGT
jgi:hypothetical protein